MTSTGGPVRELSVLFEGGGFFEGPRWHDGTWWASDFYRHTVCRIATDGSTTVVGEVAGQPSGLGWLPDGTLLVASMKDHTLFRFADGALTEVADLTPYVTGHVNDMVVDAHGHAFVGNFGFDLMGGGRPHS